LLFFLSSDLESVPLVISKMSHIRQRDNLLDKNFLEFTNYMLIPGGKIHRSEVVDRFRSGFKMKFRNYKNDPVYAVPTELEVELLLFRWNDKYAKAEVTSDGFYIGVQLNPKMLALERERAAPNSPSSKAKQGTSSRTGSSPLTHEDEGKLLLKRALRASQKDGVVEGVSASDLAALNLQLEQIALLESAKISNEGDRKPAARNSSVQKAVYK